MEVIDFIDGNLQDYVTLMIVILAILCLAVIIKFLRNKREPYATLKVEKLSIGCQRIFTDGTYTFIKKRSGVVNAIALHQLGEGIPRDMNETASQEPHARRRDGLKILFRSLGTQVVDVTEFTHVKGRIANTSIELVDEELLNGRRVVFNPEPQYQVIPHLFVVQPFVYNEDREQDFVSFAKEFGKVNQEIKAIIKSAFPTLKVLPDSPMKTNLIPEYFISQVYSAYAVDTLQTNPADKKAKINIGVFRRPLEAGSCYLTKDQSAGFLEMVVGATKVYQPAQFIIPAKTENMVYLGQAIDTITDTITMREVGFDLQHLRTNVGVYGPDRIVTMRRIIHELVKRRFRVILIDPKYSERPYQGDLHYCDFSAHSLKIGIDFNFNPLNRMGSSTGDFIDGFLSILQKVYGRGDLSRWQFLTARLKKLYDDKAKEGDDEPTLSDLLESLANADEEEPVGLGTPQLEELKQVVERILSDEKRINAIGVTTTHPFHMLFKTEGLTVIDLSAFTDRNFISFILQLLIFSMHSYLRYRSPTSPRTELNTVIIVEDANLIFPESTQYSAYRTRRIVESFDPLENLRNAALILSMQSPSDAPYLFSLPRTKIIHRVLKDTDINLVCDTIGLRERGIDSKMPHPLQETYLRTMKGNNAILYLQRRGQQAQYVPLQIDSVMMKDDRRRSYDESMVTSEEQRIPRGDQVKATMLEKDFPKDGELYYKILDALRETGTRGVIRSAVGELLPKDVDRKRLNNALNELMIKRYVLPQEHTQVDSKRVIQTVKVSAKGNEALIEYEKSMTMTPNQVVDEVFGAGDDEPLFSEDDDIGTGRRVVDVVDDNVTPVIESPIDDLIEKELQEARKIRDDFPDAATTAVCHCYDAVKLSFFKLLKMEPDSDVELLHILKALQDNKIDLPVGYQSIQNIATQHNLVLTEGNVLRREVIDAIMTDTDIIVNDLREFDGKINDKKRVMVIKAVAVEKAKDEGVIDDVDEEMVGSGIPIVIDGSNVAHGTDESKDRPSVERIIMVINSLRNNDLDDLVVIADASLYHKIKDDDNELTLYNELKGAGLLQISPAGTQADEFIINYAKKNNAWIVSNDMFRDFSETDSWVREHIEQRRIAFMFFKDDTQLELTNLPTEATVTHETHELTGEEPSGSASVDDEPLGNEELMGLLKNGISIEELSQRLGVGRHEVETQLRSRLRLSEEEFPEVVDVRKLSDAQTGHPVLVYTLKKAAMGA